MVSIIESIFPAAAVVDFFEMLCSVRVRAALTLDNKMLLMDYMIRYDIRYAVRYVTGVCCVVYFFIKYV